MIPIPETLPTLETTPATAPVVERILKGQIDPIKNMLELSTFWKIRVWFRTPQTIQIHRHWVTTSTMQGMVTKTIKSAVTEQIHTFSKLFLSGDQLCYACSKRDRHGYYFPGLEQVIKYEPVVKTRQNVFKSYEQFAARFDPFFITPAEIQKLWNGSSSQHGGKYVPSDFHQIGPQGKKVLNNFLRTFKGVNDTEHAGYKISSDNPNRKDFTEYHYSSGHPGRDISISHCNLMGFVWYSSEYAGCGNGRYGLIANKNTFLWLEDD